MSGTGPNTRIDNAMRAANVPEAQATDAILAVKADDVRSSKEDVHGLRQNVSEVRSDMQFLEWQIGVCLGLGLAVLALLPWLMFRTGAL